VDQPISKSPGDGNNKHLREREAFPRMVQFSYLLLWAIIGFGFFVGASFIGTVLGLQYYHGGGTISVSLEKFIDRLNNDKR
jgi:hypothetical protein